MTRKALLPVPLAVLVFVAGALVYSQIRPPGLAARMPAADSSMELHSIPLRDLEGVDSRLEEWSGELLVVNFWAPWCAPCRREIPALIDAHQRYAARGVRFVGISFDTPEQVRRFATEYGIDYPLFLAAGREAMYNAAFANASGSLPYTALLDRDLRILFQHHGELSLSSLRAQLEKQL